MWRSKAGWIVLVIILGLLLTAGVAYAQLKTTAVVYAWDIAASKYQNSNVIINFDGSYVPFWHEFLFDDKPFLHETFPWADYGMTDPSPCLSLGAGQTTVWEGVMYYGLYHTDLDGAAGFQDTRVWEIVDCDRTDDDAFNGADLIYTPPTWRDTIASTDSTGGELPYWILMGEEDVVTACTTGNCLNEIVTTIFINTDTDCDGQPDLGFDNNVAIPFPPAGICFYAEARTPPPPSGIMWKGPIQARISAGGGDKTVNFNPEPTAVTLRSFAARWAEVPSQLVILWAAIAAAGIGVLGALVWRLRPARR